MANTPVDTAFKLVDHAYRTTLDSLHCMTAPKYNEVPSYEYSVALERYNQLSECRDWLLSQNEGK